MSPSHRATRGAEPPRPPRRSLGRDRPRLVRAFATVVEHRQGLVDRQVAGAQAAADAVGRPRPPGSAASGEVARRSRRRVRGSWRMRPFVTKEPRRRCRAIGTAAAGPPRLAQDRGRSRRLIFAPRAVLPALGPLAHLAAFGGGEGRERAAEQGQDQREASRREAPATQTSSTSQRASSWSRSRPLPLSRPSTQAAACAGSTARESDRFNRRAASSPSIAPASSKIRAQRPATSPCNPVLVEHPGQGALPARPGARDSGSG